MEVTKDIEKFVTFLVKEGLLRIDVAENIEELGEKVYFHNGKGKQLIIKINSQTLDEGRI